MKEERRRSKKRKEVNKEKKKEEELDVFSKMTDSEDSLILCECTVMLVDKKKIGSCDRKRKAIANEYDISEHKVKAFIYARSINKQNEARLRQLADSLSIQLLIGYIALSKL